MRKLENILFKDRFEPFPTDVGVLDCVIPQATHLSFAGFLSDYAPQLLGAGTPTCGKAGETIELSASWLEAELFAFVTSESPSLHGDGDRLQLGPFEYRRDSLPGGAVNISLHINVHSPTAIMALFGERGLARAADFTL